MIVIRDIILKDRICQISLVNFRKWRGPFSMIWWRWKMRCSMGMKRWRLLSFKNYLMIQCWTQISILLSFWIKIITMSHHWKTFKERFKSTIRNSLIWISKWRVVLNSKLMLKRRPETSWVLLTKRLWCSSKKYSQ